MIISLDDSVEDEPALIGKKGHATKMSVSEDYDTATSASPAAEGATGNITSGPLPDSQGDAISPNQTLRLLLTQSLQMKAHQTCLRLMLKMKPLQRTVKPPFNYVK